MSANFTISSANETQHHQQDIANSIFCLALGTITKINQASPTNVNIANIVQVQLGYKLQNYSITKDEAIIDCLAIQQIHHPVSYKVGDKVWIAFSDTPQHNFLLHNICEIYNIEKYNQAHHLCNGIILCNISAFTSERNNQVGLVADKSSLLFTDLNEKGAEQDKGEKLELKMPFTTLSIVDSRGASESQNSTTFELKLPKTSINIVNNNNDGEVVEAKTTNTSVKITDNNGGETFELKTSKATINIDVSGNITIDTQGKISIKNSGSSLKTILDEFNTKIKAGFTSVDASAPTYGWANPPQGTTSYGDLASIISQLLQ